MFRRLDAIVQTWLDPVLRKWFAWPRPEHKPTEIAIVHDPAAARAHDLDDPFFDANVQRRVGFLIANAMLRERRRPPRAEDKALSYSEA